MFEHGVNRAGPLRIPSRPGLAFEFLEEVWCPIHRYGVEVNGLRYNGPGLDGYRGQISAHRGEHAGNWPVAVDRADVRRIFFQDPKSPHRWHRLDWEHAPALNGPASLEALKYARRIATRTHRFPDTKRALIELLERWGAGLTADRTERRMAVRLSQDRLRLVDDETLPDAVADLPSVRRVLALGVPEESAGQQAAPDLHMVAAVESDLGGDDDEDGECEALAVDEEADSVVDEDDFYADIWESR